MPNKKKESPGVFTGFYTSPEMVNMIRMHALYHNNPVSHEFRTILNNWRKDNEITEEKLMLALVEKIKVEKEIQSLKEQNQEVEPITDEQFLARFGKRISSVLVDKIIALYNEKKNS
jgi:hypothetical protein